MSIDGLTEFLLARIAEEEVDAREFYRGLELEFAGGSNDFDERRSHALAECEVKRQLIELAQGLVYLREIGDPIAPSTPVGQDILEILAVPYADHPDYREEWRP